MVKYFKRSSSIVKKAEENKNFKPFWFVYNPNKQLDYGILTEDNVFVNPKDIKDKKIKKFSTDEKADDYVSHNWMKLIKDPAFEQAYDRYYDMHNDDPESEEDLGFEQLTYNYVETQEDLNNIENLMWD